MPGGDVLHCGATAYAQGQVETFEEFFITGAPTAAYLAVQYAVNGELGVDVLQFCRAALARPKCFIA